MPLRRMKRWFGASLLGPLGAALEQLGSVKEIARSRDVTRWSAGEHRGLLAGLIALAGPVASRRALQRISA